MGVTTAAGVGVTAGSYDLTEWGKVEKVRTAWDTWIWAFSLSGLLKL